jgi:hypothetical protein
MVCQGCKTTRTIHAKGLCVACYRRERRKKTLVDELGRLLDRAKLHLSTRQAILELFSGRTTEQKPVPSSITEHDSVPPDQITEQKPVPSRKRSPLERGLEAQYKELTRIYPTCTRSQFADLWKKCKGDINQLRLRIAKYERQALGYSLDT